MRPHRVRYRSPLVTSAVLFLAGPALAASLEQTSLVQATVCQNSGQVSDDFFYNSNGMGNRSKNATLKAVCPVPLNVTSTTSGSLAKMGAGGSSCDNNTASRPWVEVYDRHTTANVSCTLFVMLPGGGPLASFSTSSSGSASGIKRLFFNADGTALPGGRQLVVTCNVPPLNNDFSFVAAIGVPTCQVTP